MTGQPSSSRASPSGGRICCPGGGRPNHKSKITNRKTGFRGSRSKGRYEIPTSQIPTPNELQLQPLNSNGVASASRRICSGEINFYFAFQVNRRSITEVSKQLQKSDLRLLLLILLVLLISSCATSISEDVFGQNDSSHFTNKTSLESFAYLNDPWIRDFHSTPLDPKLDRYIEIDNIVKTIKAKISSKQASPDLILVATSETLFDVYGFAPMDVFSEYSEIIVRNMYSSYETSVQLVSVAWAINNKKSSCIPLSLLTKFVFDRLGLQSNLATTGNHMFIQVLLGDGSIVNYDPLLRGARISEEKYMNTQSIADYIKEDLSRPAAIKMLTDDMARSIILTNLAHTEKLKMKSSINIIDEILTPALEYWPGNERAVLLLCAIFFDKKDYHGVIKSITTFKQSAKLSGHLLCAKGMAEWGIGNQEEALSNMNEGCKLRPTDHIALMYYAIYLSKSAKWNESINVFTKLQSISRREIWLLFAIINEKDVHGNHKVGDLLNEIFNCGYYKYYDTLHLRYIYEACMTIEEYVLAFKVIEELENRYPKSIEIIIRRMQIYLKCRDTDNAVKAFRMIVSIRDELEIRSDIINKFIDSKMLDAARLILNETIGKYGRSDELIVIEKRINQQ